MRMLNVDVLFGQNELTNPTSFINQLDILEIGNGVFDHMNVINTYSPNAPNEQPTEFTSDAILNIDFEDGMNAGNIDGVLSGVNQILIKKRPLGQYTNISDGWITIASIAINESEDLQFIAYDYTCANNVTYEYTLVPTLSQQQGGLLVEIESSITNNSVILDVLSEFTSVFICTTNDFQKLRADVSYDSGTYNQLVGVHQTLGSKYPIIVSNSAIDYMSGGVTGTILNKGYGAVDGVTGEMVRLDRSAIIQAREEFTEFILEKTPKILKDWNGNVWLIMITDNPQYTFENNWGMGIGTLNFAWTEIGDATNEKDLEKSEMIYRG